MKIPLLKRLKRQLHRDVAVAQDAVVEAVYELEPQAVLHGGTAVWRCYGGNRFSEDVDFYMGRPNSGFELEKALERRGLQMEKFKQTENAVYAKALFGRTQVAFEASGFKRGVKPVIAEYEKADGGSIDVLTLSARELLKEKLAAYRNRRLIRDFYDVYHLSRLVREGLRAELDGLPEPLDEKNLASLLLAGAVPSYRQMVETVKARLSK